MKKVNEDRRRFFRITDAIGVNYSIAETNDDESKQAADAASEAINIRELLESQNQAIKSSLEVLEKTNPDAAAAISALDKKIDTLAKLVEIDNMADGAPSHSIQQASISACGIAFPVAESLAASTKLNLTLFLETSGEQVTALGQVIDCQSLPEEGSYYLRVEFVEMNDSDREKLIQHIIQRQGSLLRSLKEQMD